MIKKEISKRTQQDLKEFAKKNPEIKAKNDVKPEEEEDMQDEMDLAVAKQQASSENEDVDF